VKRRYRLTQAADFKRVRRYGKSFAHPLIVLVALANQVEYSRFAVAAGRALGGAVQRNRAKRLIRAAIDPYIENTKPGWDIILIARRPFLRADLEAARKTLGVLLDRANLLLKPNDHA